jgi:hypothetical protein
VKADLRAELLRRVVPDQEARWAHDSGAMQQADADNLPWIRQVVAEHGWPGRSDVGDDGAQAAWLLVQHADADPAFQRECLGLLTAAVGQGEARRAHLALLTDRVLVAEGQPQEYGTQLRYRGGECVPFPLRDPEQVDERRAAMALQPLAEYVAIVAEQERRPPGPPVAELTCPRCQADVEIELANPDGESEGACTSCGMTFRIAPAGPGDYGEITP